MFQQPRRFLDELNRFLVIVAAVCFAVSWFFQYRTAGKLICTGLAAAAFILFILRALSRDQSARYRENMKYLTAETAVTTFFRNLFRGGPASSAGAPKSHRARKARKNPTWAEIKQYKYLICPQCAQRLRVPRGKGRLRVTCTRCGNIFEAKS